MKPDFSGWATKVGLRCSDGRTILAHAFKRQHEEEVPLVYQHGHNDIKDVLGHAILYDRPEGVWVDAFFNDSDSAAHALSAVRNRDIKNLSIYANDLIERSKQVVHGVIREVSLVLAGANPGALIDPVSIRHSDNDIEELEGEAIIHTGLDFEDVSVDDEKEEEETKDEESKEDESKEDESLEHADGGDKTVADVLNGMTEEQQAVVQFLIADALDQGGSANHSNIDDQEGTNEMGKRHNVFEKDGKTEHVLSHDAIKGIFAAAQKGGSLKAALTEYANEHLQHGIDDIEVLFPDAQPIDGQTPAWVTRQMEWVGEWLSATRKSPFSRIKSHFADLTHEEARAKGYIKGNYKKEQFFTTSRRETTPKTVYKKQKLDRDDIIDITDFDVVAWLRVEMRFMLEEEIARAALIGDGRDPADEDKIDETKIRPIASDDEFYVHTVYVQLDDANSDYLEVVDAVTRNRSRYKGTGTCLLYTSPSPRDS